jgi:uncharacterized protein
VELFTLSADQGNAGAQSSLGSCSYNGEGVQQNRTLAVELFTLAADQGLAVAQYNLYVILVATEWLRT